MDNKNEINIIGPIEKVKPTLVVPKKYAGGLPALSSSFHHLRKEMNLGSCSKTLFKLNQFNGIDCPGCAWPDPDDDRSGLGEYCENGVKAISEEATSKRIGADFFKKHSIKELSNWSDYELGKSGRLTEPLILKAGASHYESISWKEAIKKISTKLKSLENPNDAVFYTSGRTSNEAAFLYQLFVRNYGTNNLPDCSNMCHESSGVGLSETVGIGKGSVRLEDFYVSDLIIVMGQNPGTNHPRMLSALQKAKKSGAKIVNINPLEEVGLDTFKHPQKIGDILGKGTKLSNLHLPVIINGDVALLKAIMVLLLEKETNDPRSTFDHDFINEHTDFYEEFIGDLEQYNFDELCRLSGLETTQVIELAEMIHASKKIIICWAMGLTQHKNGVSNIKEIVNLLLLKGSIGKPGAGTCPVRGHSNVQGDRTMGIWEKPKPHFLNKLKDNFGFQPPLKNGYNVVEAIDAMHNKKVKVFFAMGGNFLSASPDTELTGKALQTCDLTVQVSTKLNRSHVITGKEAIILPCLGRTELDKRVSGTGFLSVENSMGIVHATQGSLEPASQELKSEPDIVIALAKETLNNPSIDWESFRLDYNNIRDAIEATIPGFENYNVRVLNEGGFYLPNGAREGKFTTHNGNAKFSVNPLPDLGRKDGEFIMMTIRSHDQFNTTIYGMDDRYRGILNGRRVVMMNESDIQDLGFKERDLVDLISEYDDVKRVAPSFMIVKYKIPKTCIATYFPEANVLIPYNKYADKSHTPISKSVIVKLKRSDSL